MRTKLILPAGAGLLAVVLVATAFIDGNNRSGLRSATTPGRLPPGRGNLRSMSPKQEDRAKELTAEQQFPGDFEASLLAALAETNPAHRTQLLRKWADTVGIGAMEKTLEQLDAIRNHRLRSEVYGVLLSSWGEQDLSGMADWFGKRGGADALHQQARDALVRDFGLRDPAGMLSWMEQSLPESVRGELYGPFFRQWAAADPASAGAKLQQLAEESQGNRAQWNDMIAQVASVWAGADLSSAIGWVQSLPEGVAKSQALVQVSYRWAQTSPQAAAACAAKENDPKLLSAVAGKWAESDPESAAVWAAGLPAGAGQDGATLNVASMWAQKDPAAAVRWALSQPIGEERNQFVAQVAVVQARTSPAEAARLVLQEISPGSKQDNAVLAVLDFWARQDLNSAYAWVNQFPADLPLVERAKAVLAASNNKQTP